MQLHYVTSLGQVIIIFTIEVHTCYTQCIHRYMHLRFDKWTSTQPNIIILALYYINKVPIEDILYTHLYNNI